MSNKAPNMPARSFRMNKNRNLVATPDNRNIDSAQSRPSTAAIVTPTKPSRIRKQTAHYNPLEENRKPQHTQSPKTPTKNKNTNNRQTVPKSSEVVKEEKETRLILKPVSKELLCHHCNVGGDLMQCHRHGALGGVVVKNEIGCGKVVHSFCVGREEIPKGDWICTTCSNHHGFKVKLPKELRNKDIADYGHAFIGSESSSPDMHCSLEQQLEKALAEWKPKATTSSEHTLEWQPTTLFGSLSGDEYAENDEDDSSYAHHSAVGPCDVCKDDGELIRCRSDLTGTGCGKGVHMYCVFREEMPEGDWVCEDCARHNNLKLDNKYPAMGYEYPVADLVSIPKGEDTFEWNEGIGYRIQVGSRIGIYDDEDDAYENGTVEYKDVCRGIFHLLFDDGERKPVDLRNRRIRLLSEKEIVPTYADLQLKMRLSLDPSLPNYIICGGGVTKAHDRKHAHRLLEHFVDVVLDDDIAGSWNRVGIYNDFMCQQVLKNLKENDIEFIQWDATIGGFGKASKKEVISKISSTIEGKRMERAQMPRGQIHSTVMPHDNNPILHVLLVNGGHPQPIIHRKRVSDDPFLAMQRLQERHQRNYARESRIMSMQR